MTTQVLNSPELVERYWNKFYQVNAAQQKIYSDEALKWFRLRVSKDVRVKASSIIESSSDKYVRRTSKHTSRTAMGKLYLYEYEAETAGNSELGVYDRFPMVFFFGSFKSKEGKIILLGLNVHYLQPNQRAALYKALMKLKTTKGISERTRLRMEWETIKTVAGAKIAETAIHAYRADRFVSRVVEIPAEDWIVAVFLRTERWVKPVTHSPATQTHIKRLLRQKFT